MPYLTLAFGHQQPRFLAWRIAFFVPAALQMIMSLFILFFGQVQPALPSLTQLGE